MARLEIKHEMGQGDIDAVSELLAVAEEVDGHAPLGEHKWLDLVQGGREGFAGLVAWETGHDHPVGYAQLTRESRGAKPSWALEFVVDPHHRDAGDDIGPALVERALGLVRAEGGGHVHLWVPKPGPEHDRIAAAVGLRRGRELRQLRRPLPVEGERSSLPVRPFRPGVDEEAWLEVNNRAFNWHEEQGGWDLEVLRDREAQPWFDPDGFLLHERDGRLAGFCWTKVHLDHAPPLGEIYVLAVDPDFRGLGLGRSLTLAGLDWLAGRGLEVAMLYVDADNTPALRLYEHLGFTVDHVDRAYVGDVDGDAQPAAPTPTADPMA
ncbi:MAG TPA: mycothiol synthase [Acidimicrobiales bacterium]|nr:mycothiol synthase [Acidimicrobiales bacterium]